jgi:hypothetical protein
VSIFSKAASPFLRDGHVKIFTSAGLEAARELLAYSKLSEGYKKGLFSF